jgi:hypothetical protein
MEISFPFVACVRNAGRKKICQIVVVQFLQGGLGPFRGLDAPRAPKTNDNPVLWPSQPPLGQFSAWCRLRNACRTHRSRAEPTFQTSKFIGGSGTSESGPSSANEIGNDMQAFRH